MAKVRPMHWLAAQASAGVKDLPRNGAWVLSRAVGSSGLASGAAADAGRRVSAGVADALPGAHDSVEVSVESEPTKPDQSQAGRAGGLSGGRTADSLAQAAKDVAEQRPKRLREGGP